MGGCQRCPAVNITPACCLPMAFNTPPSHAPLPDKNRPPARPGADAQHPVRRAGHALHGHPQGAQGVEPLASTIDEPKFHINRMGTKKGAAVRVPGAGPHLQPPVQCCTHAVPATAQPYWSYEASNTTSHPPPPSSLPLSSACMRSRRATARPSCEWRGLKGGGGGRGRSRRLQGAALQTWV